MKTKKQIAAFVLMLCVLFSALHLPCYTALAAGSDAAAEIESKLSEYKVGETQIISDDGYIGIGAELTVYFDRNNFEAEAGYNKTPVMLYVVNANIERVGTDSDDKIIKSMLERGFAVAVLDYKNNEKAASPALDWSVQGIRSKLVSGTYFTSGELSEVFPGGAYRECLVVPSGYNVKYNNVFWEIDKHSSMGTMEKIVEIWNNDFRAAKGDNLIKWTDESSNRKDVQTDFDGSEPVWFDAAGSENENGEYTKVKYTLAKEISDCVKANGEAIDLNLYMHIIYPTNPENDVAVMCLASSSEHLAGATQTADRPQLNGFSFNGYAVAVYDYGLTPMARSDHWGYFDGSSSSENRTGDNLTYSIQWYNDVKINTAAMRYIRYLAASDNTCCFNAEAIGVYGNSKGGWMTMLGEENPEVLREKRVAELEDGMVCDGKSRYEHGDVEDNGVIDGGEAQPWIEYEGLKIDSGADFVYASCGGGETQITRGHAPTFISCNKSDSTYYTTSNAFVNACRINDIPALWLEVDKGHTFAYGKDLNYGVDTYDALFDFAGYYLKDEPVKVIYADRPAQYSGLPTNAPITVKFSGAVNESEIEKVTVTDSEGNLAEGIWSSKFGNTEWTFEPYTLKGGTEYTLTVPYGICGDNGKAMEEKFVFSFETGKEEARELDAVKTTDGTTISFTLPDKSEFSQFDANVYALRVKVVNDAANVLLLCDAETNEVVSSRVVSKGGYYDFDITEYLSSFNAGDEVSFIIKAQKEAAENEIYFESFDDGVVKSSVYYAANHSVANTADGESALLISGFLPNQGSSVKNNKFYQNPYTIFTNDSLIKDGALDESDMGRRFRIGLSIYDTSSRYVNINLNSMSSSADKTVDYNRHYYNIKTNENAWTDFEFEYDVYELQYGEVGKQRKKLTVSCEQNGENSDEIYFDSLKVTEIITEAEIDEAVQLIASTTEQETDSLITEYGTIPEIYTDAEEYPFVVFDKDGQCVYATDVFAKDSGEGAITFAQQQKEIDYTILMRRDFTFSGAHNNLSFVYGNLTLDLGGYTLTNTGTLFNAQAKRSPDTNITVKNGTLVSAGGEFVKFASADSASYDYKNKVKNFNFVFDGLTLKYAGSTGNAVFAKTGGVAVPVNGYLTLNNCTIDLTGSAINEGSVLFNASADSNGYLSSGIVIMGGTLKADSLDGITIGKSVSAKEASNVFKYSKNSDGEYMKIELASSANAPSESFVSDEGLLSCILKETKNNISYYELEDLNTPYGIIPNTYYDTVKYPFAIFEDNGNGAYTFKTAGMFFVDGGIEWNARSYEKAVIYMRCDYEISATFNNFATRHNTVIDLGGNTLTATSSVSGQCKIASGIDYKTDIIFKNGTIITKDNPFINFSVHSNGNGRSMKVSFEDIVFKRTSGATAQYPFMRFFGGQSYSCAINILFDNCIFDLAKDYPESGVVLFVSGDTSSKITSNVTVNGGKIIACDLADVTISKVDNSLSSINFVKYPDVETEVSRTQLSVSVINGDSVIVNGADKGASSTEEVYTGDALNLSADGEGEFMYWIDANTNTILSYDESFSYTVGTNRSLTAVYADSGATFVTFISNANKVIGAGLASSITVPAGPYLHGYKFNSWYVKGGEKTTLVAGDAVAATENTTYVAAFVKDNVKYSVTVNGEVSEHNYNEKLELETATEKDGKSFAYWKRDGMIVSYNASYCFYVNGDTTVEAVYGENAKNGIVLVMANPVLVNNEKIAFFAERDIPSKYTMIESGILLGYSSGLNIDNASVKAVAKSTANKGQFTIRKSKLEDGKTYYGVAYAIYRDDSGNLNTAYSNEVSYTY